MSGVKRLVLVCVMLTWCPRAFALNPTLDVSQYAHTAWRIREGFTKGAINAIAQTADGYLWLGTEVGLLRFDGVRNVPWQPPAGEQLPNSYIRTLLAARDGTLWIGTRKGLARWKDGKLTQHSELAGAFVNSLLQDRAGTVWVGGLEAGNGRLCAIEGGGTVRCHTGSFGNGVGALYEDRKGILWVASDMGVQRWGPGAPDHYPFPGRGTYVDSLIESDSGTIMMATSDGLKELVGGTIRSYTLPGFARQFRPNRLFRSRDGSLWVGTQQGLFHVRQGRVDRFTAADGLSGDFVNSIFEDRESDLWVSTLAGLDRFREFAVPTISSKQGGTWSVQATPDGSIWIGGPRGLHRWENGAVSEVANSRLSRAVQSLGRDDRGRLWVSTANGVFYSEGGRFMPVPGVPGGNIFSITADSNAKVWISDGNAGLFSVTPEGAVQQITWDRLGQRSAAGPLLPDRVHRGLWLGFVDRIVFLNDGRVRASYNSARVTHLHLGADGAVWAATEGGLSRVKDGRITTLTSANGLPCDGVHWAIEDDNESWWLYMPCGLGRIARAELDGWVSDSTRVVQATIFDSSDGVRGLGVYGGYGPHVTKSADGKIWFLPAGDGVSVIDPRNLPVNKLPPPVHIEQVIANRMSYDAASGLRLPPLIRDLQIDYTALSLVAPEKNRFRMRLEGWDHDWQDVGTRRQAFYSNLPPRTYRLRVIASNNSGVWNETGAVLDFSIAPAYYQTAWFRTLALVTFLSLLWSAYRIRLRVIERHQAEITALNESLMKAQEQERTRIAGELHDGVMQQISALSIMLGTARRKIRSDVEAKAEIRDVQKKLIQVGTEVRQLSHDLHPASLKDRGLPDALRVYCDEFSRVLGISVSCDADGAVGELSRGAALALYRIAQEAMGNAVSHGAAQHVDVRLARSNGRVTLTVTDDGKGFDPNRIGGSGGLGLINMRERARQLNGTFELNAQPGRGTTVRVAIPFR
jgi:signal transduction histidine kinase/ligand-binding sensor domain-containing protein